MKRFALNVVLACMAFVAVYIIVLFCSNINNIREARKLAGKEVLSCCYSHEVCGIDDEVWLEYGNFNSSDTPPWVWHSKLKFLVNYMGARPKYVIIERGLHDAYKDHLPDFVANRFSSYFLLQLLAPTCPYNPLVDGKGCVGMVLSAMPFSSVWIEHYDDNLVLPKKDGPRQVADVDVNDPVYDIFLKSLDDYIVWIKSIGAEPILVTMPCRADYKSCFSENVRTLWKRQTEILIQRHALRYYNYLDLPLPDDAFRDADHLRKKGRDVITQYLMKDLGYASKFYGQWYIDNEWWWKPIREGRYSGQQLGTVK